MIEAFSRSRLANRNRTDLLAMPRMLVEQSLRIDCRIQVAPPRNMLLVTGDVFSLMPVNLRARFFARFLAASLFALGDALHRPTCRSRRCPPLLGHVDPLGTVDGAAARPFLRRFQQ